MINRRSTFSVWVALYVLTGLGFVPGLNAQTVHYKTETRMKMHMLGGLGNMMGNKPITSESFVTKEYMRTDDGDRNVTIFSLPDGKFYTLDTRKKTYYEMSFDDMVQMMDNARESMQSQMGEADSSYDPEDLEFNISVEDLGGRENVAGYAAEQKLMQMEVKFTADFEDEEGNVESTGGKFYMVSEMWISKDVPGYDIVTEFGQNFAEQMGQAFSGANGGGFVAMQQALMSDGRMQPAMERMAEEMKKLDGAPLRTVSYMVLAPEDSELDIDAVLNNKEAAQEQKNKRRRAGLGGIARNALKNRGINVGNNDDEADAAPEISEQQILTETETVYLLIETVSDDSERFNIPANFKQVDAPDYGGRR